MLEKHYSVQNLAEAWNVSTHTIRKMFKDVEGVLVIRHQKNGKRIYVTRMIPHSVAEREYNRRLSHVRR